MDIHPKGRIMGQPHASSDGIAMIDLDVRCQHTDEEADPADCISILVD